MKLLALVSRYNWKFHSNDSICKYEIKFSSFCLRMTSFNKSTVQWLLRDLCYANKRVSHMGNLFLILPQLDEQVSKYINLSSQNTKQMPAFFKWLNGGNSVIDIERQPPSAFVWELLLLLQFQAHNRHT